MDKFSLVSQLFADASRLKEFDLAAQDAMVRRAKMIARNVFGQGTSYVADIEAILFFPQIASQDMPEQILRDAWENGKTEFTNLCRTMIQEINLTEEQEREKKLAEEKMSNRIPTTAKDASLSNRVFIVHGHDSEMKLAVARTLEQLSLEPIILHEQPNQGRTVIEKFVDHSDVGFAVVLLSGDDLAFPRMGTAADAKPRARQNVILELGFFLGKLGRNRVLTLYRKVHNFELPSDYEGVLYKEFDSAGAWKIELWRELKSAGYSVDANKLI